MQKAAPDRLLKLLSYSCFRVIDAKRSFAFSYDEGGTFAKLPNDLTTIIARYAEPGLKQPSLQLHLSVRQ